MNYLSLALSLAGSVAAFAAPMTFTDVTVPSGIAHSHHFPDTVALGYNVRAGWMAGGAVAEDFNGDGLIDLYVLQGGSVDNLLYINCGGGLFKEEGSTRGANISHPGMGAAAADYDNDGDIDICATSFIAPHYILENDGTGHFSVSATLPSPVDSVMSPSWGDVNNDGQLELMIAQWRTTTAMNLYWNLGNGNMQLTKQIAGDFFFSPVFADIDSDRNSDLLLVSDYVSTQYQINGGAGLFTLGGNGTDENGMGSAVGDYDNDGDLDWFVSAIKDDNGAQGFWGEQGNRLYRNDGSGSFTDVTDTAGVRDGYWGWGSAFADFDLDGDLDLFHVNGWPEFILDTYVEFGETPARLYENLGGGVFQEVASISGVDHDGQGRGVAVFDIENDGDLDIFIVNNQDSSLPGGVLQSDPGTPVLYRNDSSTTNHWLKVELDGEAPLHSDGIGSRVYVTAGATTQMRELNASTGFLAHGPNRIAHFGLGSAVSASQVRALWTNGDETHLPDVAADQAVTVESPKAQVSKRCVAPGVSVTMSADPGDYPVGATLEWTVGGMTYSNPNTINFVSVGEKVLQLDVHDGATLLRSELLMVRVVAEPLDTDGDEMPDAWEELYGFNKNSAADAHLDADLDGQDNLDEFLAGTHPKNSASVLHLVAAPGDQGLRLSWPSELQKTYRLLGSSDFKDWTKSAAWPILIPGSGGMNSIELLTDQPMQGFKIAIEEKE